MDEQSFFGGLLHVCYAPEFETVEETRRKLESRRAYIARCTRSKGMEDLWLQLCWDRHWQPLVLESPVSLGAGGSKVALAGPLAMGLVQGVPRHVSSGEILRKCRRHPWRDRKSCTYLPRV